MRVRCKLTGPAPPSSITLTVYKDKATNATRAVANWVSAGSYSTLALYYQLRSSPPGAWQRVHLLAYRTSYDEFSERDASELRAIKLQGLGRDRCPGVNSSEIYPAPPLLPDPFAFERLFLNSTTFAFHWQRPRDLVHQIAYFEASVQFYYCIMYTRTYNSVCTYTRNRKLTYEYILCLPTYIHCSIDTSRQHLISLPKCHIRMTFLYFSILMTLISYTYR